MLNKVKDNCEKIAKENGFKLGSSAERVMRFLALTSDGYCPCKLRTEDTKCPCTGWKEQVEKEGKCHCGLYTK